MRWSLLAAGPGEKSVLYAVPSMPRRRIWCETVPADTLAAPTTVELLRRYGVDPILAVWPTTVSSGHAAARRFADAGLRPALWPMLADADGRWLGAGNAALFCDFAEGLAASAVEIVFDLEPPIAALRASIASSALHAHLLPGAAEAAAFPPARERIARCCDAVRARGVRVSAAIALPVLFDRPSGPAGWQARLGTPVDGIAWDHVSAMLYSSIVEGWSRGLLSRRDALAILAGACRASVRRFGAAAGASLGAVGTGAFGDEPTYRSPAELAEDVALARAAGVDDFALFDLGGVLGRPPAEAWLDAFTGTTPVPSLPEPTLKARAFLAALRIAGGVLGLITPR
jgi:hypothetical protein